MKKQHIITVVLRDRTNILDRSKYAAVVVVLFIVDFP